VIGDRDVERPSKSFADNVFNVFAESEDEPDIAAVWRRKCLRRGDVPEDIVNDDDGDDDDDELACESRHRPVKRRTMSKSNSTRYCL
jgi:hypothetical protein